VNLNWAVFFHETVRSCNEAWDSVACAELVDSWVSCLQDRAVCVPGDECRKKHPWEERRETSPKV